VSGAAFRKTSAAAAQDHAIHTRRGTAATSRAWLGSLRLGSLRLGSLRLGSLRLGSLRLGSLRLGSLRLGSLRLGSLRLGSLRLGSLDPPSPGVSADGLRELGVESPCTEQRLSRAGVRRHTHSPL
jgi:hypothetical protein